MSEENGLEKKIINVEVIENKNIDLNNYKKHHEKLREEREYRIGALPF